jgi:hypothetical protein
MDHVSGVNHPVTIGIPSIQRNRGRSAYKEIVYQKHNVSYIDHIISIGITDHIVAGDINLLLVG